MNKVLFSMLGTTFLLLLLPLNTLAQDQDLQAGKILYERKCQQCHGAQGKGDGPAASFQSPKPRDLTTDLYTIRTTPSGQLPNDDDLFKVITEGMPGTAMPAWSMLSEKERRQLIRYIKTFSPRFTEEPAPESISVGEELPPSEEILEKGKQLYQDLECFKCHGQAGRGDGPSAPELEDDLGNPIRAANLSQAWLFRGGSSARDIYIRFNTGMAGTPMPSYADSIEPEHSWQLAHYVKSLGRDQPNYGTIIVAKRVKGSLPEDVNDPLWNKAKGVNFPLIGQVIANPRLFAPTIEMITVKALYNERDIAILATWDDPSKSVPDPAKKIFSDAIALQFPANLTEGRERPYLLLGDRGQPVYLLRWSSDGSGIQEVNAMGLGKEKVQPKESQTAKGKVLYHQGRYRMLVTRALVTEDKDNDIQFQPGKFIPITFMAWDGSNGERGGQMSLSSWYYLLLEEAPSRRPFLFPPLAMLIAIGLELFILKRVRGKG